MGTHEIREIRLDATATARWRDDREAGHAFRDGVRAALDAGVRPSLGPHTVVRLVGADGKELV